MMNCSHYHDDVQCIILYTVFVEAIVLLICVACITGLCCIVWKNYSPYKGTNVNTQHEQQVNENTDVGDNLAGSTKEVKKTFQSNKHRNTDEEAADNCVLEPGKAKDPRKPTPVFVLLKDGRLVECVDDLLKGIGLSPNYFYWENVPPIDEKGNYMFKDETTTIIIVRHSSTRLDSDIGGCCKHISDSDIKRTVVVIINEFANNKKGKHGEIIKPNSYDIDNIDDLKIIVVINYKCCIKKTKCKKCYDALHAFRQHAISPNYK